MRIFYKDIFSKTTGEGKFYVLRIFFDDIFEQAVLYLLFYIIEAVLRFFPKLIEERNSILLLFFRIDKKEIFMNECEYLEGCPFFNDKMKGMTSLSNIYKRQYCTGGEKSDCARYMVREKMGKEHVPVDLYPNQKERAEMIISQKK